MPAKLLVLGIDAASPVLLRRWAAEGKLPAIRSLLDRGTSGAIRGVEGFFVGSTWPSLYTGLNPAAHGFYRIDQLKSGTYDVFRPLGTPSGVGGQPFWKLASEAGRRVAVLDVPLSCLDSTVNGLQIVEWGGHDAVFGFQATQPELANHVMSTVGAYPLPRTCDDTSRQGAGDFDGFIGDLEFAAGKKGELTLDLLAKEDWDLFVQVFTESHCVGHQCWHLHDATHPAHDPEAVAEIGDPLERVYRAIDRAVAEIITLAGDARILVISAHGMGPYRGAQFLLPEILFRLGVTARRSPRSRPRTPRDVLLAATRVGWRMLPGGIREALRPLRARLDPRGSSRSTRPWLAAELGSSRCFPVPNGAPVSGIRLNLVGREPQGVLHPGPETDAFFDELARDLREIVDERSGRPLVAAVHRTETIYRGARREALPDLLVEWTGDPPTGTQALAGGRGATIHATSTKIGSISGTNYYGRTGDHLPEGMFIFTGPGIPAAERHEPVSLMDFHPTICRLLNLPEPDVDGAVVPDLAPSLA